MPRGNRSRRKDIRQPCRIFYSLGRRYFAVRDPPVGFGARCHRASRLPEQTSSIRRAGRQCPRCLQWRSESVSSRRPNDLLVCYGVAAVVARRALYKRFLFSHFEDHVCLAQIPSGAWQKYSITVRCQWATCVRPLERFGHRASERVDAGQEALPQILHSEAVASLQEPAHPEAAPPFAVVYLLAAPGCG